MSAPGPEQPAPKKRHGHSRLMGPAPVEHHALVEPTTGPLPRWFWLLPVLVAALWWPIDSFWASDDFLAVYYAQDLSRALSDFVGPQYAATDIWLFYRPLITLSFWLDTAIAGANPVISHVSNVLAHTVSALLVGLLWRRLLDDSRAFAAGLLWAIAAGHIGTVAWAVGRVDGHTTVWILLSVWLFVRWLEGMPWARTLSVVAMMLALMSKELALCLPGLVMLCAFAKGSGSLAPRALRAAGQCWPHVLLLCSYVASRILLLGQFGGYTAAALRPVPMLEGLGEYVLDLLNPLRWTQPLTETNSVALMGPGMEGAVGWLPWLGYLPALLALVYLARTRHRLATTLLLIGLFLCASVPVAPFLYFWDNHHNLRYFYLAFAALAGLLVAPGRWRAALALLVFAIPFVQVRYEQVQADRSSAAIHEKLLAQQADGLTGPWFLAGLPRQSRHNVALQYHFGVDRMLQPPFGPGGLQVYAHRPASEAPGVIRLENAEGMPIAPPAGNTLLFRGPDLLTTVPAETLPELPILVEGEGGTDFSGDALLRMAAGEARTLKTPGIQAPAFRITLFTSTGYLSAVFDQPLLTDEGSTIDWATFFKTAQWATEGQNYWLVGLEVPSTIDLDTTFPLLVEAGQGSGHEFVPTHRARELLEFRIDRDFPKMLRAVLGL